MALGVEDAAGERRTGHILTRRSAAPGIGGKPGLNPVKELGCDQGRVKTGSQAMAGVCRWITFYNHQRPHAAHGGQPPAVVYFNQIETDQQGQRVA